ncbi:YafY family protein [Paenibacillus sp. HB172176]|uniref:helix-turn-helix transcriptional regulator n=1 Tax=Paenibacillus sp. HB172176 TaxID=2493690 RepID=UPI00143A7901|nr:YafY family protein [Paenibacillus sp. HB172176]
MSKSKRLMELMMTVNRMRKFTVRELADQFQVSSRTILRDLQELSELGVPLYSEVGPHGGYQVLKERILPPIAFGEDEAVAMFFASHALRHYLFLPFETEASKALNKFYYYMPGDVRDRIDQMKNRVDFFTPTRQLQHAHLAVLLEAAIQQKVLRIDYGSRGSKSSRSIQPVGIYASNGFWYCPAYCFLREDFRLFRCDRMMEVEDDPAVVPLEHGHIHLGNWQDFIRAERPEMRMVVELTSEGAQRCEAEVWPAPRLELGEDGSGRLDQLVPRSELPFFAKFFLGLGEDARVVEPPELVELIRRTLSELAARYEA